MNNYTPKPIDVSDVELSDELTELREVIAENVHEIWALQRQQEGWTYGPERNDALKQTPNLVPYAQLTDVEKEYDRIMAIKTLKMLKKAGYDLIKVENTDLYATLRERIRFAGFEYRCRRCGHPLSRNQIFCDQCGLELMIDWKH